MQRGLSVIAELLVVTRRRNPQNGINWRVVELVYCKEPQQKLSATD